MRSTPPCSSSPVAIGGSGARVRQRAISAAILVPVLLVVLAIGGIALALAVAAITALAAREAFALLKAAGLPTLPLLGGALALTIIADAAFPQVLEGSGLLLAAVGIVLVAVASFAQPDPRDGLTTWMATVFGALYVSLLAFVVRLGNAAPAVPADAPLAWLGPERGWILLLVLAVWSYDTGAFLVGRRYGTTKFLTHISPSKSIQGLIGGVVATVVVVAAVLVGLGQAPRARPGPGAPGRPGRPGRRPGRVRCSSARPGPRTRARSSRAMAGCSTGWTRSCSRRPVVTLYVVAVLA